jgi:hypothetical protein
VLCSSSVLFVFECFVVFADQVVCTQRELYSSLVPHEAVLDFVVKQSSLCTDDAVLYEMSLKCEPKIVT